MPLLLCLETSSRNCSVSLFENAQLLSFRESKEGYSHAEKLHPFIDEVLKESGKKLNEMDGLMMGAGPGSFTGLRIGSAAAKGLCFALSIPLMAFPSLKNMTLVLKESSSKDLLEDDIRFCPMIDARRMEVYTTMFDLQLNALEETEPKILSIDTYDEILNGYKVIFFGDGMNKVQDMYSNNPNALFEENIFPSSKVMGEVAEEFFANGKFEDIAYYEPFYLKGFQPTTPKNKINL